MYNIHINKIDTGIQSSSLFSANGKSMLRGFFFLDGIFEAAVTGKALCVQIVTLPTLCLYFSYSGLENK